MGVRKPNGMNIILMVVFVLAFVFVKSLNDRSVMPDMGFADGLVIQPIAIAAIVQPRLGYMIVPYDQYTGRAAASPFELVYREYDACLLALFDKRATMGRFKTQYAMSIKCDRPSDNL